MPPVGTVTKKDLLLKACRAEPVDRVPVWMMRQAGRYLPEYRAIRQRHSFLEVCKTPELAVEVSLQPYRILGVDAIIVFSDILIPAEAMGMELELTDSGPVLPRPIRSARDVSALRDFDPANETRFLMDAISQLCREAGPDVPVLGFAAAPWTLACYIIEGQTKAGFSATKQLMYSDPALLRRLLDAIVRSTVKYLRAQIAAGAAAVQLFDTWAGELNRSDYDTFALPATQQVIQGLRATRTPVILYTKASAHLLGRVAQAGADVLSFDWRIDLATARDVLGSRVALQGNVDPCVLLGPAEGIRRAVQQAIAATGGEGHILNLGHGILPSTPVENARLFIQAGQGCPLPGRASARVR
jgi:uroporphyrinogen decarboxylase